MVAERMSALGTELEVDDGVVTRKCFVVQKPFYDPKKHLPLMDDGFEKEVGLTEAINAAEY